ncbi:DUF2225 domain-containing protein [Clostridium luticellarii]|jgi:uncharacterized protein (DUF2225 family)|uniref:DUF2225 domain-containing protein n=1 Tax=Clostridium luticellarii TaxID=1691940 RepID=A0A2T0BQL0_9CLOT|nr:DUF2225 domain-containing protein [Clostridium luticellarii]MCI1944789.1 DUF2225 domain-containing protein [Clostridium luticellarii]MCI1968284.1 DUF2225 domain-containing protein [Clostridium luticellarii]MCI1995679.1 DUF2225 domain-containing protein [Clostridium luticellarii]MCI2040241.1 DUF2225 domain-containing protein [Clostridium luticellarii]PRR86159.1 hypothetical protein CLLU_08090 [Clostridium luticellarii]
MPKKSFSEPDDLNCRGGLNELWEKDRQKPLLYNKKIICPVCGTEFNAKAIKKSSYRIVKKDSDFFIRYSIINPYFYDVWVCDNCGYAAIKNDFPNLSDRDADIIKEKISSRWHPKNYPEVYDVDLALQRYKLSLLNYHVIGAKASKKAINFLKIAWMYRLKEDSENETKSLIQALDNFSTAYYNEPSPICGMEKFTTMYLIGELMRRTGKGEDSLIWFSQILTSITAPAKIKDMARDQKDLVKDSAEDRPLSSDEQYNNILKDNKSHSLFAKFRK